MPDGPPKAEESLRLDLFLKRTRLAKRRTVIQQMCEAGLVTVNGHAAKAGKGVRPGDRIGLPGGRVVRVEAIPTDKKALEPAAYYAVVGVEDGTRA